jgi:hypothetical protein
VSVRGVIVYQADSQGLISTMKMSFDNIAALTQMGLFPPPAPALQLSIDLCAALTIEGIPGQRSEQALTSSPAP